MRHEGDHEEQARAIDQAGVVERIGEQRIAVANQRRDDAAVGGEGAGDVVLGSAEIYDPSAGTYTPTGSLTNARSLAVGV
ncbi:hypothetical protein [uncultured Caulobacter sp.]|uniref:hypothetical protein n=1 Tax=uncultured Caulobacter sp. TaxID=158749 RepID=UPI00261BB5F1|nr:hypothetical protein [uncultured Caulobacter sp.]